MRSHFGAYYLNIVSICRGFRTNLICVRVNCYVTIKRNMTNVSDKPSATQNNVDGGYRDCSPPDSLFKRTFKFYKRHDVTPNFSKVLNLRRSSSTHGIICSKFEPTVAPSDEMLDKLGLRPLSEWTASTIAHRPGMVILNDVFKPISHLQWMKRSLFVYAEPPGFTNIGVEVPNARNVSSDVRIYEC